MKLIDVHCHLEREELIENLETLIDEAKEAGIIKLITSSVTPKQWKVSEDIAKTYDMVEFSLGIHPWFASISDINCLDDLSESKNLGAIAIGEIGLDLMIDNPDIELQKIIFEKQLSIAREIDLPVIIHVRKAFNETIQSMKKIGLPRAGGFIHSFGGSLEIAEEFIKLGLSFSFGGILTQQISQKRENVLKKVYPHHFMVETDSPDMVPFPVTEKPNKPSNILHTLRAASKILQVSEEKIAEQSTANALELFNLHV